MEQKQSKMPHACIECKYHLDETCPIFTFLGSPSCRAKRDQDEKDLDTLKKAILACMVY